MERYREISIGSQRKRQKEKKKNFRYISDRMRWNNTIMKYCVGKLYVLYSALFINCIPLTITAITISVAFEIIMSTAVAIMQYKFVLKSL